MKLTRGQKSLASSLSFWTTTIIAISTVLLVSIGLLFNIQNKNIGDQIEVQFEEVLQVQNLQRSSQSIISSYRGYIAYGRNEFVENKFLDIEDLLAKLDQIGSMMDPDKAKERRQGDAITYIQSSWRELSNQMQLGIEYKKSGDTAAIDLLSETKVTPMIESLNLRFADLMKLQESYVKELMSSNKVLGNWLLAIPLFIIVFSCVMGYYLVFYLRRSVIEPVLSMSDAVSHIAEGNYVEVESTARNDELGSLQRGVKRMSEELRKRASELDSFNRELINQRDLLEVQNEEITAQQEEQQETLHKLTAREQELELITTYQEKLAGYLDLEEFMEATMPPLLQVLGVDAAAIVLQKTPLDPVEVIYRSGYPETMEIAGPSVLFGPAQRVFAEKKLISKSRQLAGAEMGVHGLYERAVDHYVPLIGNDQDVFGFLLLTIYGGHSLREDGDFAKRGVVNQFSLAMHTQVLNADRQKQSALMGHLNEELLKEKKYILEQRDFYTKINESIHEGMLIVSPQGQVLYANQRMEAYFGYKTRPDDTLDTFCDWISRNNRGSPLALRTAVTNLQQGESQVYHERFQVTEEQGSRYFEVYVNPVEGSDLVRKSFLFVFRDRTDEEKADEAKNEFVSIVSHELRTPLSSVLGFIEILLNRQVTPEKQQRYLETIHNEAMRLSTLINDFLDLQRMEAGKQIYQPVPCDMAELINQVCEQWSEKDTHTIRIKQPVNPVMALADMDRLRQVLHNLISNAIKYSPKTEFIDIACSVEDAYIRVDVQDYGLGIPDDSKEKLFSKFFRVDNTDRRQIGGTGLGLAIVKEIIEAHEGRLSFVSELGHGSTFSIWLPAYKPKDLSGKIVIIEDDENLAKMLAISFEKMQLPTVQLSSAEDAVYSMNSSAASPVICIVDIQLKGVRSGWDFISVLLKHPLHRETPVIVTTVLEQPNHFYETTKERYLQKPFTIERMLELVELLITQSKSDAPFVFPVQDKQIITDSLQHNGIVVREIKVNTDFIEVNIDKDENNRI